MLSRRQILTSTTAAAAVAAVGVPAAAEAAPDPLEAGLREIVADIRSCDGRVISGVFLPLQVLADRIERLLGEDAEEATEKFRSFVASERRILVNEDAREGWQHLLRVVEGRS